MSNYIIINKDSFKGRLDELKKTINEHVGYANAEIYYEIDILLSDSIPLAPELEKAFEAGNKRGWSGYPDTDNWTQPNKQDYITQLKLEI